MNLIERIKAAYTKTSVVPDRADCYQPMKVLFVAEFDFTPPEATLQFWMFDKVFGSVAKMEGFIVGFGTDIPNPPSNAREFSDGFYEGKKLVKELAC